LLETVRESLVAQWLTMDQKLQDHDQIELFCSDVIEFQLFAEVFIYDWMYTYMQTYRCSLLRIYVGLAQACPSYGSLHSH